MSTRLFVRLHRDAAVPGARLPWILRNDRGVMLGRGEDTVPALPAADRIIAIVAQELVLIRPVRLPPGRRARTPAALANAMEPYLLSEPAANYVLALGECGERGTLLAAIARGWLDTVLAELRQAQREPARVLLEASLLARAPERWVAVCHADGGFLVTSDGEAMALDAAADGGVPEGLRWQARSAAEAESTQRAARALRVHHAAAAPIDRAAWESALGMTIEDAGPWDWARATGPESGFALPAAPDLLAQLGRERSGAQSRLRAWRLPLALTAAALGLHIGATAVLWSMRSVERSALSTEMSRVFRNSVSASEPLVDAALQTRRALIGAQRAAGQYAPDDFLTLLGRVAAELPGTPPPALRSIQYGAGTLSLEWRDLPAARVQRLAEQLRARGLHVEVAAATPQVRITLRVQP